MSRGQSAIQVVRQPDGVTVIRPTPTWPAASPLVHRRCTPANIFAFVEPMIDKDTKQLRIKPEDEIVAATLLTYDGAIVHPAFAPAGKGGAL
jgi:NAD/NADP transhydrogenase alpha subunit